VSKLKFKRLGNLPKVIGQVKDNAGIPGKLRFSHSKTMVGFRIPSLYSGVGLGLK
jgi:hypothetical protein